MSVTARIDLGQFNALVKGLSAPFDWGPTLKQVKVLLVAETKRNFDESRSPDGVPWLPLKSPRRKGRTGEKPLRDKGILMASVSAESAPGAVREVRQGGQGPVIVHGSALFYAGWQQRGTRTIPARPFVGINARIRGRAALIASDQAARQMKERAAALNLARQWRDLSR